ADDDPHKLARLWQSEHARHSDGLRVRYYRQGFWQWTGSRFELVPDDEMRAQLARFCRTELEIANRAAVAEFTGQGDRPCIPKVSRELVSNVMQALTGDLLLPPETPQPCWLEGTKTEERNYLCVVSGLLDDDAFVAGK